MFLSVGFVFFKSKYYVSTFFTFIVNWIPINNLIHIYICSSLFLQNIPHTLLLYCSHINIYLLWNFWKKKKYIVYGKFTILIHFIYKIFSFDWFHFLNQKHSSVHILLHTLLSILQNFLYTLHSFFYTLFVMWKAINSIIVNTSR